MIKELQYVLENERMVNNSLRVALEERDATIRIELLLERLGKNIQCDRIYVLEGKRESLVDNTFEWCAEGIATEKEVLQKVSFDAVERWYTTFETQSYFVIDDIEAIKEKEPSTYKYLKSRNIQSVALAPLKIGGEIIGFFGVDNPSEESMHNITYIVEIVAHFIVALLERKQLIDKLEALSYIDPLTGLNNRHALNEVIKNKENFKNVGILYCDTIGLKRINDTFGHKAGDELLIRTSKCLQSTFRKNDIFRIGGDEFLVFSYDINENIFCKKVEVLQEKMKEYNVTMSLGAIWKSEITNVEHAITEADALMYENKRAYYASCKMKV